MVIRSQRQKVIANSLVLWSSVILTLLADGNSLVPICDSFILNTLTNIYIYFWIVTYKHNYDITLSEIRIVISYSTNTILLSEVCYFVIQTTISRFHLPRYEPSSSAGLSMSTISADTVHQQYSIDNMAMALLVISCQAHTYIHCATHSHIFSMECHIYCRTKLSLPVSMSSAACSTSPAVYTKTINSWLSHIVGNGITYWSTWQKSWTSSTNKRRDM